MKILIVYYSKTGNTKLIAETLAKDLNADLEELTEIQPRTGILGWLIGGKDATLQNSSPINELKSNLKDYDLVVIGTPIWAWNVSPPVRSFLEKHKPDLKQIAFFATMGGSGDKRAFSCMAKLLDLIPIATTAELDNKIKNGDFKSKLGKFTEIIKEKLNIE